MPVPLPKKNNENTKSIIKSTGNRIINETNKVSMNSINRFKCNQCKQVQEKAPCRNCFGVENNPVYQKQFSTSSSSSSNAGFQNRFNPKKRAVLRSLNPAASQNRILQPRTVSTNDSNTNSIGEVYSSVDFPMKFDEEAIKKWICPISDVYASRDYQQHIAQAALMKNTLVCLPTGLGKTFIAAVVMLNFYRWFPEGKIIFMAPNKPLVEQQVEACHNIVGIPCDDTAMLTGKTKSTARLTYWNTKRVFYCTPQTVEKDCQAGLIPFEKVVLIVVDEAHRGVGEYAYVKVIREANLKNPAFRVLALSATPGSDRKKIQDVIINLQIAQIEYRSEDDPDVQKYVFSRELEVMEVKATDTQNALKNLLSSVIQLPLQRLQEANVHPMFMSPTLSYDRVQTFWREATSNLQPITLGYLGALSFFLSIDKFLNTGFKSALAKVHTKMEKPSGYLRGLFELEEWRSFYASLSSAATGSHSPKLWTLKELLVEHFNRYQNGSKHTSVIIFTEYRHGVAEIESFLNENTTFRVSPFVGQGNRKKNSKAPVDDTESMASRGQTQAQQQDIVRKFRSGELDVLIATCIGEEGLDIGSVDLVVAFDSLSSPIRMVQRFGRAGRKRAGRVVVLVAENGNEKTKMVNGSAKSKSVAKLLKNPSSGLEFFKQPVCLFPDGRLPVICSQVLDIGDYHASQVEGLAKKSTKSRRASEATTATRASSITTSLMETPLTEEEQRLVDDIGVGAMLEGVRPSGFLGKGSRSKVLMNVHAYIAEGRCYVDASRRKPTASEDPIFFDSSQSDDPDQNVDDLVIHRNSTVSTDDASYMCGSSTTELFVKNSVSAQGSTPTLGNQTVVRGEMQATTETASETPLSNDGNDSDDCESIFEAIIPAPPGFTSDNIVDIVTRSKCAVCRGGDTSLIQCVECGTKVHAKCCRKSEPWCCDPCLQGVPVAQLHCILCPNRGGLLKHIGHNCWAHISCCVLNNRIMTTDDEDDFGIRNSIECGCINHGEDFCTYCFEKSGICAPCSVVDCSNFLHVECVFSDPSVGNTDILCRHHAIATQKKPRAQGDTLRKVKSLNDYEEIQEIHSSDSKIPVPLAEEHSQRLEFTETQAVRLVTEPDDNSRKNTVHVENPCTALDKDKRKITTESSIEILRTVAHENNQKSAGSNIEKMVTAPDSKCLEIMSDVDVEELATLHDENVLEETGSNFESLVCVGEPVAKPDAKDEEINKYNAGKKSVFIPDETRQKSTAEEPVPKPAARDEEIGKYDAGKKSALILDETMQKSTMFNAEEPVTIRDEDSQEIKGLDVDKFAHTTIAYNADQIATVIPETPIVSNLVSLLDDMDTETDIDDAPENSNTREDPVGNASPSRKEDDSAVALPQCAPSLEGSKTNKLESEIIASASCYDNIHTTQTESPAKVVTSSSTPPRRKSRDQWRQMCTTPKIRARPSTQRIGMQRCDSSQDMNKSCSRSSANPPNLSVVTPPAVVSSCNKSSEVILLATSPSKTPCQGPASQCHAMTPDEIVNTTNIRKRKYKRISDDDSGDDTVVPPVTRNCMPSKKCKVVDGMMDEQDTKIITSRLRKPKFTTIDDESDDDEIVAQQPKQKTYMVSENRTSKSMRTSQPYMRQNKRPRRSSSDDHARRMVAEEAEVSGSASSDEDHEDDVNDSMDGFIDDSSPIINSRRSSKRVESESQAAFHSKFMIENSPQRTQKWLRDLKLDLATSSIDTSQEGSQVSHSQDESSQSETIDSGSQLSEIEDKADKEGSPVSMIFSSHDDASQLYANDDSSQSSEVVEHVVNQEIPEAEKEPCRYQIASTLEDENSVSVELQHPESSLIMWYSRSSDEALVSVKDELCNQHMCNVFPVSSIFLDGADFVLSANCCAVLIAPEQTVEVLDAAKLHDRLRKLLMSYTTVLCVFQCNFSKANGSLMDIYRGCLELCENVRMLTSPGYRATASILVRALSAHAEQQDDLNSLQIGRIMRHRLPQEMIKRIRFLLGIRGINLASALRLMLLSSNLKEVFLPNMSPSNLGIKIPGMHKRIKICISSFVMRHWLN